LVFGAIDRWRGERILARLVELKATERWDRARLEARQLDRLRSMLRHAKRSVPFYRDIEPDDVRRISDLRQLPIVERGDLLREPDRFLATDDFGAAHWDVTSGSTGVPLRFLRSTEASGLHRALNLRALSWYGVEPGARQARFWGTPIVAKDRRREAFKDAILNRVRYSSFDMDERSIAASLLRLARQRPRYLYGYPSAIHAYAVHLLRRGRGVLGDWRPAVVMTTAEVLFPVQARDIESAFESPVCNEYGASEATLIAASCPQNGMHISAEAVIVEYEPTGLEIEGAPAYRLLLTDLANRAMPLLRYRIGDLGRPVDVPCRCGRGLPLMTVVGGREVDLITTPSGRRLHGSIFSYLGKSILIEGGVRRFRATQIRGDAIEVEFEPGPDFRPECLERMSRELSARLNGEVGVSFVRVAEIQPEPSGKLRYFRPLRG
jgi:phenylacetate-CoA ligase